MNSASCNIISRLGGGATSEVFLAERREGAGEPFVIKRLAPHLCGNSEYIKLFEHEARLLGSLNHPGIPRLIEFRDSGDAPEIHMQFRPGKSLFAILQDSRRLKETLPLNTAQRILGGLFDIVAHIHEAHAPDGKALHALHRDICPMNIIIGPQDTASLIDFGSASSVMLESEPEEALFGRFSYLAPEQTQGGCATTASEIFALGIVSYELFCGVHPFRANGAESTLRNIESASCMSPGCACPGLPAPVESLIARLLRIDPTKRPASVRAALAELNSIEM